LQNVPPADSPELTGDGDVWKITGSAESGRRRIRHDPATGTIVEERFTSYPRPYRIEQQGGAPGKIALTFDDGPDPRFTPRILDILRDEHAPATFFVTGIAAYQPPHLLQRAYAEGHEIGNHTYTHTDLEELTPSQLRLELALTQRLIQSRLGVSTLLFRPPYGVDDQAVSPTAFERLRAVQQLGYRIVGSQIDANDWGTEHDAAPPGSHEIVESVLAQARAGDGHVVLMHDGGGERKNTVAALPRIIEGLRASGFELVPVSTLLGETRADAMPSLGFGGRWMARANAVVFDAFHAVRLGVAAVCLTAIMLLTIRSLAVVTLAILHKRRRVAAPTAGFDPLVTVLVPGYDEEKVIVHTLESVLQSDYPQLEVIVIDDGSRDGTGDLVASRFACDGRVRLLRQANQGKSAALNRGVDQARGEILVTIDADTRVEPATIAKLVRHFVDEASRGSQATPKSPIARAESRAGKRSSTSAARTSRSAPSTCSTASPSYPAPSAPGAPRPSERAAASRGTPWPRIRTSH
jgi:peptidoglycan/xylan/chitin deacetylase (PgdA/CDA1 family)